MIRFENGSVLVTNDPVITYDHINTGQTDGSPKIHERPRLKPLSLMQAVWEALWMLALFALCAWMGFHS